MTGTVALTGATGFVGGHVLRALLMAGWRVNALMRGPARLNAAPGLTVIEGDLADEQALARLIGGVDLIIHCAGVTKAATNAEFFRVNTAGTATLATVAATGTNPPRFILMSSLAAREPALSAYADSKRQAEAAVDELGNALQWTALRPPAVYGPGDQDILLYFKQFDKGLAFLPGDAAQRLSLIHVSDLADAVVALAGISGYDGGPIEVHDGHAGGYRWQDIVAVATEVFGHPIRTVPVPRPIMLLLAACTRAGSRVLGKRPILSPGKVDELYHPDWVCQGNFLCELTDWKPRIGLAQGLGETLRWYREAGML